MFLFYSLMCRNYQEYKRKTCWSRIGTLLKSVPELFSEFASLTLEDDVIWRPGCYKSCHNFPYEDFKPEISPIGVRTRPVDPFWWNPKRGWRKSEKIYKGRKPRSWPTPHTHKFPATKATFLPPPWIPSPWGRAPKKPWRREAKGRRSPSLPAAGKGVPRTAGAAALPLSAVFTAISITISSLYSVVHPPTNLCTVLCKHGVWCYNIYPMIYIMFP